MLRTWDLSCGQVSQVRTISRQIVIRLKRLWGLVKPLLVNRLWWGRVEFRAGILPVPIGADFLLETLLSSCSLDF